MDNKKALDILENIKKVIIGKDEVIEKVLIAILAKGHLLIEDIPGVGKTTLAKAFLEGRNYVIPDDAKEMIMPVLGHRLILSPEARIERKNMEEILKGVFKRVFIPVISNA
ncbi:AAA family ATPase [Clostridium sp. Cult2]|uniref:AAA family ATPase n=1 Tax=Clostridium sp. Cult2 TaxID=2079003 RepID=UPI00235162E0|nr:hypothetical protein [Clostridium sp. Cult2]MCF6464937.1 hypothetical protein [Clostridium sp. Cult2]